MNNKGDFWKSKEKEIVIHGEKMNVVESCVDRHALENPKRIAFFFEEEDGKIVKYTYGQLEEEINRFANLLRAIGIKTGERVALFLPKVPELYIGILGTIKAGCVAVPLFEAFQEEGIRLRLEKGDVNILITNKWLGERIEKIKNKIGSLKKILITDSAEYKSLSKKQSSEFEPILKDKKDTHLMMFTSSTAGTPVAGIELPQYGLVQQHFTAESVLGLKQDDKYWCTAHPGWVTGSIYGILAPLSVGCSVYVYCGHFKANKFINFLNENKISVVYTAPTALRMLKGEIKKSDLKFVRTLCSVGEALTQSTFDYYKELGVEIIDTYWQTETGAIMIANTEKKKGSMGRAIPGIEIKILGGVIVARKGWPSMMRGIYKHDKMYREYFDGEWFKTNDLAKIDAKGYFYFNARKDDIIKTSGERVSPIEIESALMKHEAVEEAAVIGVPDEIKGSIVKAFVVLRKGTDGNEKLKEEIGEFVKKNYAGHAYPKIIEFVKSLPKTNSGKIIRMKLREKSS